MDIDTAKMPRKGTKCLSEYGSPGCVEALFESTVQSELLLNPALVAENWEINLPILVLMQVHG